MVNIFNFFVVLGCLFDTIDTEVGILIAGVFLYLQFNLMTSLGLVLNYLKRICSIEQSFEFSEILNIGIQPSKF